AGSDFRVRAALPRGGLGRQALLDILLPDAVGLAPPLQFRQALADRVRRPGDGLDPRVEPLDLLLDLVVDHQVRADRDERLVDDLRLRRDERVRADRDEDLGAAARVPILGQGLLRPQVLLERDADQVLLLGERLDLLAVLVEDGDAATKVGFAEAHAPASRAYRTA